MERIASFCVDHNTLVPGMYLSRKDGDVLTWDIRMKRRTRAAICPLPAPIRLSICLPPMPATVNGASM